MAMAAALSCLTPLAGRHASACLGFFRATALRSSNSPAATVAGFSVLTSNAECGLRSSSSWRVRGDEERFSGAGVRTEHRRAIIVKAADQGAIDSPLMSSMTTKIKDSLKAQEVSVVDAYGDGRHVSIDVVAEAFEGQSRVSRQRMVYKAIWEELQSAVHAVDNLRTRTPKEAADAGKNL